jgi:hypothetical protein
LLIDLLDKGVRGVDALAEVMNIQPIGAIPYITTKAEVKRNKYMVYYCLLGFLSIVLIILLVTHLFVMPLDAVLAKILNRF